MQKLKGAGNAAGSKSKERNPQNWPVFAGVVFGFCGLTLVILTIDVARGWFQGRCMNRKMEDSEKGHEKGTFPYPGPSTQWMSVPKMPE